MGRSGDLVGQLAQGCVRTKCVEPGQHAGTRASPPTTTNGTPHTGTSVTTHTGTSVTTHRVTLT